MMKKLNLGQELSKGEQKKVLGGSCVVCNDGTHVDPMPCSSGPAYCSFHGGLEGCY